MICLRFPSCHFPGRWTRENGFLLSPTVKGAGGSFKSLGGTRNYSLYWAIHSHCRIASIPGHRLLNAMKTPSHCDNQEIHIHILRHAQVLPQLTSREKSVFLNMVDKGLLTPTLDCWPSSLLPHTWFSGNSDYRAVTSPSTPSPN